MKPEKHKKIFEVDVLILGAGISGLAAGYTLSKNKKIRFVVLEAQSRIGGRILSATLKNALIVEHGAEWIGVTHKNIRKICKALDVSLEKHAYVSPPYIHQGQRIPDKRLREILEKLDTILLSEKNICALEKISLLKFFQMNFFPQEVAMLRTVYSAEFGDDPRNVSAFREVMDFTLGGKNTHMDFHVKGGNNKFVDALRAIVGDERIYKRHEVQVITQGREGVVVACTNGTEWRAKKVICTLPAQIIAHMHFSPALPAHMKSAAQNLRYGNIVKVMLLFPERFWLKEDFSFFSDGFVQYVFHATQGQPGLAGVLCLYAVGARADVLRTMSVTHVWSELKKIFPKEINMKGIKPIKLQVHSWKEDRFTQGAYAVYQPKEWPRVQKAFGKPYRHIYFAGEHLGEMQGFMEGAVTTGISAVKSVIHDLEI